MTITNRSYILSTIIMAASLLIGLIMPLVILIALLKLKTKVKEDPRLERFGLFEEYNDKTIWQPMFLLFFYLRRVIITVIIIYY